MATMTRSKSQVIRGFLPGQTFQHPNDTIVKVSMLYAAPADVTPQACSPAAALRLAKVRPPATAPGVNREVVVPSPSSPYSLSPQQYAAPADVRPQVE